MFDWQSQSILWFVSDVNMFSNVIVDITLVELLIHFGSTIYYTFGLGVVVTWLVCWLRIEQSRFELGWGLCVLGRSCNLIKNAVVYLGWTSHPIRG